MSVERYRKLLINLLPKGRLWRPQEQPIFNSLLRATAVELSRVAGRVVAMLTEVDPRTADETLDTWEGVLGLPDECTPPNQTINERRTQAVQKLTNTGGLSKTYYEFLTNQLGFETTVTNLTPFVAGSPAGKALTNFFNRKFVAGSEAGRQLREIGWRYYFEVELPATAAQVFTAGSLAGEPLRLFSNELIECTIKKNKPGHAGVVFRFTE